MTRRRGISRLRSDFYKAARDLGDVQGAANGPGSYAKRSIRKVAYRRTGGVLGRLLRSLGL